MIFSLTQLSLIILVLSLLVPRSLSSSQDAAALLAFKSSADGSNSLSSWVNLSSPCLGSWVGVTCNTETRRVAKLVLENLGLRGDVRPLSRLAELRVLSLQRNGFESLSGVNLSSWPNLKQLYLSNNRFSGEFPSGITGLRRLLRLDLSHNNFSGEIPVAELARLPRLLTLRLEGNSFAGTLGSVGDSFGSVSDFNVSNNDLSGAIPAGLSRFSATAFSGNKRLCGKPLPFDCNTNRTVAVESVQSDVVARKGKRLSDRAALSIAAVDAAAVVAALVAVTWYCYRRKRCCEMSSDSGSRVEKETYGRNYNREPASGGGGGGGGEMVVFEGCCRGIERVDDLLRSSAELMGKGRVGTTYKVVMEGGGGGVAVVVVKRVREDLRRKKKISGGGGWLREIGGLRHPNVVGLRAYYCSQDELLLVYDYLPGGSLHSLLHESRGPGRTPLDWITRVKIASGAACGLAYIHQYNDLKLVHGHLNSSNIIVDSSGSACISDAGLHQLLPSSSEDAHRAPELVPNNGTHKKYTQKCDVYSFGVVLLEILTGKMATGEGETSLVKWVQRVPQEEWRREVFDFELLSYKDMEEEMASVLQVALLCVAPLPRDRPKMSVIYRMIEDIRTKGGREGPGNCSVNSLSSDSSRSPYERTPLQDDLVE